MNLEYLEDQWRANALKMWPAFSSGDLATYRACVERSRELHRAILLARQHVRSVRECSCGVKGI
jgi:hypothetical protein